MNTPFIVPLGFFALVVLIVAIVDLTKIRDREIEVHQRLRVEELDHQRRMKELESEMARIRDGK